MKMHHSLVMLTAHQIRSIAVEAKRDPRTVVRFIDDPARVKSTARASIEEAIARLGFADAIPKSNP